MNGKIIVEFKDGEVVAVLPIADSDVEAAKLLELLRQAAIVGEISDLRDHD